jgi:hypothetical protein
MSISKFPNVTVKSREKKESVSGANEWAAVVCSQSQAPPTSGKKVDYRPYDSSSSIPPIFHSSFHIKQSTSDPLNFLTLLLARYRRIISQMAFVEL